MNPLYTNSQPCTVPAVSPEQSAHYDTVPRAGHCHREPTIYPSWYCKEVKRGNYTKYSATSWKLHGAKAHKPTTVTQMSDTKLLFLLLLLKIMFRIKRDVYFPTEKVSKQWIFLLLPVNKNTTIHDNETKVVLHLSVSVHTALSVPSTHGSWTLLPPDLSDNVQPNKYADNADT